MDNRTLEMRFESLASNVDQLFLVVMGMIIFFMQCGFAFLEAGAVRSKNTTNILIKNVMDSFVSGVAYWIFGYAFAFGDGGRVNAFIGATYFASDKLPTTQYGKFFFQYTFAATASTIVSGAMAERCEFIAYIVYSFFITGFVYPVVAHWAWGDGWLASGMDYTMEFQGNVAYRDFAGSGVVHVLGGVAAFVGAAVLGPRIGRFSRKPKTVIHIRGHSVPIASLGGFILFFGFLAFNGGSQSSITADGDGAAIAISIVNTIIAASFSALCTLFIHRFSIIGNTWSLLATINGALTGMVAACAGCNRMYPWEACILGIFASISYTLWSAIMRKLRVDDPIDAVAVHFGGGIWGVIAVAFFDIDDGVLLNWTRRSGFLFAWQLCGLVVIIGWTAFLSFLLFSILYAFGLLRVSRQTEEKGLDIAKHNEPAYPVEAYGHGHDEEILQLIRGNHPIKVRQGFERLERDQITDKGPYEHPETNAVYRYLSAFPRGTPEHWNQRYLIPRPLYVPGAQYPIARSYPVWPSDSFM